MYEELKEILGLSGLGDKLVGEHLARVTKVPNLMSLLYVKLQE